MKNLFRLSAILLLPMAASAGEPPEAPSPQPAAFVSEIPTTPKPARFWTPINLALVSADGFLKSYDMWSTMRNASRPNFVEHDPIARPFVHSGPVVAGLSQGALFATEVFTSYLLNKRGHRTMAKSLLLFAIGGNSAGIATSTH
ncbi:MAG TPA: hypothetical protein VND65_14195 [Candidatus Binatia bacterium]|nr:hypothetical protein [Candidatus Binatia bacterium]